MAFDFQQIAFEWRLAARPACVFGVLSRLEKLRDWCPLLSGEVLELDAGDEAGIGRILRLRVEGSLPYLLHAHVRVTELVPKESLAFQVWGDIVGQGEWRVSQSAEETLVHFGLRFRIAKGPVRLFNRFLGPVFRANYAAALVAAEQGLEAAANGEARGAEAEKRAARLPLLPLFISVIAAAAFLSRRSGRRR